HGGISKELFPGGDPPPTELPQRAEPLAVAYLAAPYSGGLKGLAADFRIGPKAPGTSLTAKLIQPDGEPWQGYRVELFEGTTGKPSDRLSYEGKSLGLGGTTPLAPSLYVFVPESRPVRISKLWAWDSDAWLEKADDFSVMSDTSFQLEAIPVKLGPGGAPIDGQPPDWLKGEVIACVNKRSPRPTCDEGTGAVIEDPLSGQP